MTAHLSVPLTFSEGGWAHALQVCCVHLLMLSTQKIKKAKDFPLCSFHFSWVVPDNCAACSPGQISFTQTSLCCLQHRAECLRTVLLLEIDSLNTFQNSHMHCMWRE